MADKSKRIVIAITGASGGVYARETLRRVSSHYDKVYVIVSQHGAEVMRRELGSDDIRGLMDTPEKITVLDNSDLGAPPASGSHVCAGMVIVPCSMGTVGRIAAGVSQDLISRAADVCLKEGRKLILVPRETPLSAIHLENLLKLARAGAVILPASPPFYHNPQSIDDLVDAVVDRILTRLGIGENVVDEWNG